MECYGANIIAVIPSGGMGIRMRPFKTWKELIPVGYRLCLYEGDEKIIPKVIGEYTLENILRAGVKKIVMVLNEHKSELVRFYSDGGRYGTSIAYVCQDTGTHLYGMPVALDCSYEWIKDHTVLMGMPDTIVQPDDCFKRLLELHNEKKSDLTLGVFPTNYPTRLAPVVIDNATKRVKAIYDKPEKTDIYNTWNIAVWSGKFTELIHTYLKEYKSGLINHKKEVLLSDIFNKAIENKLEVYGMLFEDGHCHDLGNIDELIDIKHHLEKKLYKEYKTKIKSKRIMMKKRQGL